MSVSSKIFMKNRALGYVSNHVPCVTRFSNKREEYMICTSIGKNFHTYGSNHLKLLAVSDSIPEDISCLASDKKDIFSGSGNTIYSWKRNTNVKFTFVGHENPIFLLLPFGRDLISVDEGNVLKVWERQFQDCVLSLNFSILTFKITAISHPHTYINKILLGSEQGLLQLWNIETSALIYTFNGWGSAVTVLEQSPALDVYAIGLSNGKIILHNLKFDETVVDFKQDWGPVTCISFRTDDAAPIMITGSTVGNIVLWNLEERKVASQILNAHNGSICSAICFPMEPLLLTSSSDNSIKIWIFDQIDGGGRILRLREGHSASPTMIKFYGRDSNHILSAGRDSSLRVFNTVSETLNYSLGRASYDQKLMKKNKHKSQYLLMPPIVNFSSSLTREKDWDSIAAIHHGIPETTSWSYDKRKMGSHKLLPEHLKNVTRSKITDIATSVHVTNCGNFVVVGYSTGYVHRFNLQSGIHRCSYGTKTAHEGSIRGVTVDSLNQIVISGCNEGYLKFWPFQASRSSIIQPKYLKNLDINEGISFFRVHEESSLIGVILENFSVSLINIELRRVARRFSGHSGQITDVCFSPDARWMISASVDGSIRTWDIPTGSLIDIFKVDSPCTSVSFSPTGNYLATSHANNLGIYLWTNKTLFTHVSFKPIKETDAVPKISLPSTGVETTTQLEKPDVEFEDEDNFSSNKQIENLITFSDLSASRWKNLLDLDTIKLRNKSKEPPKQPAKAPFFLPTLPGPSIVFDYSSVKKDSDNSRTPNLFNILNYTAFGNLLLNTKHTGDFTQVIEKLKTMSPTTLDFEISALGIEAQGSVELLEQFLAMIEFMFSNKCDFELAHAYFAKFIQTHSTFLIEEPILLSYVKRIDKGQKAFSGWEILENDIMYCLTVIGFHIGSN